MKKTYLISIICFVLLTACANMFNGVVFPNQCKKCEVINKLNNEVLYSDEGCGSDNTKLEEEAKIEAYNLSRFSSLCDLEVSCTTWKQDSEIKK